MRGLRVICSKCNRKTKSITRMLNFVARGVVVLSIGKIWRKFVIVEDINSLTERDQDVAFIMKKERNILIHRVEFMGDVISLFEEDEIIKKIKKKESKVLIIIVEELDSGKFKQILRCKNLDDKEALATLVIGEDQLLTKIKGW